jgi:toxin-antitoxin system PIN domain toxin
MILPDANLLLYAVNTDSPDHRAAFEWWESLLESGAEVGLYTGVAFAFVRLATNRRVFGQPLSVEAAFAYLQNWLAFPSVTLVDAEAEDLVQAQRLLMEAGTGGNLVSDAQIAAAALRLKASIHSADADFDRFSGIDWQNPLRR